jgi:hypothetical protein
VHVGDVNQIVGQWRPFNEHPELREINMGSTTWDYFTRYEADVGAALGRLRKRVFREGRYERFVPSQEDLEVMQGKLRKIGPDVPSHERERIQQQDAMIRLAGQIQSILGEWGDKPEPVPDYSKKPRTIRALLKEQGESGTHSILDIERVAARPQSGAVSPMPAKRLKEIFGTDRPTHEMVEALRGACELFEDPLVVEGWQGVYFTVYRHGKPDELFFIGTSGD